MSPFSSASPGAGSSGEALQSTDVNEMELDSSAELAENTASDTPNRQSLAACDFCRSKKSKCSGERPACRRCREAGTACVYSRRRRTRITEPCIVCRRRKIRCNGVRPACGTCSELKYPCVYQSRISAGPSFDPQTAHAPPTPIVRPDSSPCRDNIGPPSEPRQTRSASSPPPVPEYDRRGHITPPMEMSFPRDAYPDSIPDYAAFGAPWDSHPSQLSEPFPSFYQNEYTYLNISSDQVRLILLSKGRFSDPVYCSLKTMNISRLAGAQLAYQALSYSWGRGSASEEIFLKDIDMPSNTADIDDLFRIASAQAVPRRYYVRPNLAAALKRLRSETTDLWFWIDAICINQADDSEKTHQLPKMLDIYCNAWNVCIWIGDSGESEDDRGAGNEAMDFIPSIINLKVLDNMVTGEELDERTASSWANFAKLLRRAWFRRRWVIQEVAASRQATVQCGGKSINWIDFSDAVELFIAKLDRIRSLYGRTQTSKYDPDALQHVESGGASAIVSISNNLLRKTQSGTILDRLWNIESLVTTFIHFEISDPKDTIYALLPLASDGQLHSTQLSSSNTSSISPDYSKLERDIFIDFVRHCVSSTRSLDIICRHWAPPPRGFEGPFAPKRPTWIGSVLDSTFGMPSKLSGRVNGNSFVGEAGRRVYNASRSRPPDVQFSDQDNSFRPGRRVVLRTKGFQLGRIIRASSRVVDGTLSDDSLQLADWAPGRDVNSISDRLWRTLVADRTSDGKHTPFWYRRACMYCLMSLTADGDLNTTKLLANKTLPETALDYLKRVREVVWNRKFFAAAGPDSDFNQLFGIGSRRIQEGDFIYILFGCSVPVVLRQQTSEFQLIDECYVHGMMDGEAVAQLDLGISGFTVEELKIR
ncbi:heterokaryon incompatibility protein-domain-containing protein [Xylariaceae sp. FL0662B]|nr:heterokaryon incompatibility protein-domain-containing protein [Xylariaceae sp. FL0662B]